MKYVGSKRSLIHILQPFLTEPFVDAMCGGGSLVLAGLPVTEMRDSNADLIQLHKLAQSTYKSPFSEADNTEARFYALRTEYNNCTDLVRRAHLFHYLLHSCYNALPRYNKSGNFNCPYGKRKNINLTEYTIPPTVKVTHGDYAEVTGPVYCDPPYTGPAIAYNKEPWDRKRFYTWLTNRTEYTVVSEAAEAATELYSIGFTIYEFSFFRSQDRRRVNEIVAVKEGHEDRP